jgi:hypothetical protein
MAKLASIRAAANLRVGTPNVAIAFAFLTCPQDGLIARRMSKTFGDSHW